MYPVRHESWRVKKPADRLFHNTVLLDAAAGPDYSAQIVGAVMHFMLECFRFRVRQFAAPLLVGLFLCPAPAPCQDSADAGTMTRGDRAEIAVTVRDSSGELITTPASVKLYKNGVPSDQSLTSRGRAFFIPRSLGDFTIVVEAAGYKTAQKDVSMQVAVMAEVDIYLLRDLASNESVGVPGKPVLAPKAREALDKSLQALRADKLDDAQKYMSEAMRLAPGNPEVLYVQGVLYLRRNDSPRAQTVLEKSDQLEANQPRVLAALGMALCNQKKYEQAIPPLEKSMQLEPVSGWETEWALAKAYYYREQYDKALAMVQQAHSESHGSAPQVELLLAQCLTASGRFEDSAQVLRAFLKNNPKDPDAATARRWLDGLAANGKIRPAN